MNCTTLQKLVPVQIASQLAHETGVPIYLVGGAVRDALTGAFFEGDCDFAVAGGFEYIVEKFTHRINGHAIPWDFNQTRVVYRERAGKHISVDFAQCKADDILEDLHMRDFTINALAIDVAGLCGQAAPEIIDPLGGRDDLARKLVRMCNPHGFDDDPLRMLRAVRFARQAGCVIDPPTLDCCTKKHALIAGISIERIKKELFTIFNLAEPALSIRQLLQTGLLSALLPEISGWQEYVQCPPHQFKLLEHSLKTVEKLEGMLHTAAQQIPACLAEVLEEGVTRRALLFFTAFLHDSGKPAASKEVAGKRCFHGHDQEGARINRTAAERLGLGRRCRRMVSDITKNHMRLLQLSLLEKLSERAKLRFLRDCDDVAVEVVLLSLADMLATSAAPAYQVQLQTACALGEELLAQTVSRDGKHDVSPLLTGSDIITELGIKAGPQVGELLAELHLGERQGRINTREEALAWLETRKNITPDIPA